MNLLSLATIVDYRGSYFGPYAVMSYKLIDNILRLLESCNFDIIDKCNSMKPAAGYTKLLRHACYPPPPLCVLTVAP